MATSASELKSNQTTYQTGSTTTTKKKMSVDHNPFKMPADTDIFILREQEKNRKKQERHLNKTLKVHQKLTQNHKLMQTLRAELRPENFEDEETEANDEIGPLKGYQAKDDYNWIVGVTRDRRIEKESLKEYIDKKREMFLVQFSLGVKREEMRKLEEIAGAEEKRIEMAEKYLEEDAALFDEFLKENDANSVQAVKIADEETKKKTDKAVEIKKLNTQIMILRSDIAKMEDNLKEFQMYKSFLDKVTPQALKDQREVEKASFNQLSQSRLNSAQSVSSVRSIRSGKAESKVSISSKPSTSEKGTKVNSIILSKKSSIGGSDIEVAIAATEKENNEDGDSDDEDEELELYFTDPQQLLDLFLELEEQNLSLIQNSQDTEETLEEMKQTISKTRIKMEKETEALKHQIATLNEEIKKETDREADLRIKASYFSYGQFKAEEQDKMLHELKRKVEEVYRNCIGDNEANIDTLQMLTAVENKLEDLFQKIEQMPPEKVEEAEKAKEKQRRLKQREERLIEQKKYQEERIRKALERAQAAPKKITGRRLMVRSKPPTTLRVDNRGLNQAAKNDEELAYFLT